MGFFSSNDSYLGIDVGSSSIKMVELASEKGRPKLLTYGIAAIDTDIIRNADPKKQDEVIEIIKKLLIKSNVKANQCIAALPTYAVFSSVISLPVMEEKDLEKAVNVEIAKLIPLPIEEVNVDWKLVSNPVDEQNKEKEVVARPDLKILVTAAPKKLISRYMGIFEKTGLKLSGLESEAFAIIRSLLGEDKASAIIVDFGNLSTDIVVVDKGIPISTRSIRFGGSQVTDFFMQRLGTQKDVAEQFKIDLSLSINSFDKMKSMPEVLLQELSPFINEIKYIYDLYRNKRGIFVEKIVLSGGSSFLPYLPSVLTNIFDIPCFIGDPWARIRYNEEIKNVLQELGPSMSVALGLAMRQIR